MTQSVVGVRFKPVGKIYQFDPGEIQLELKDHVIVETAKGREYGEIAYTIREIPAEDIQGTLKPVLRRATPEDKRDYQELKEKEKHAREVFMERARHRGLQMKLIDVEYTFDKKKIVFYFTAEGRVDFRDLVKDLASEFRVRIELRQIGVRDEAKNFNGVGICGRPCCCSEWIGEFFPVSIKMAKEQNLSLNSSKISGICGRLLCCLTYEEAYYEEISKKLPRIGWRFKTPDGPAEVFKLKTLEERVLAKVKNEKDEIEIKSFTLDEIETFKRDADTYPDRPDKKNVAPRQKPEEKKDDKNDQNHANRGRGRNYNGQRKKRHTK
ncbi:MAG: PSP1 domain-containing protein [Eubacteriaceae bacterium]|jgi:cell fate regulator YaaT (PSP1 superfamily)